MDIKDKSYVYGLIGTDGNLYLQSRNRGKIVLELRSSDRDIIEKLISIIPHSRMSERVRNTNFSQNYHSVIFSNFQKEFRDMMIEFGLPTKDKSITLSTPSSSYSEYDFWRGVIDGNGSIGFTSTGTPFMSLTTKSEALKEQFCDFLKREYGIVKRVNRNKRDGIYNICLFREQAVDLAKDLYLNGGIAIDRKVLLAKEIQSWVRTAKKRK